jgi:acetyl-CoA/propionyl-CoA carboxylase biotin carboxyl carrier protein
VAVGKPFAKVLIANRGEIAVRVIRACRELGITTVAVHSEVDADALHVRLADERFALGGQTAAESYLNTEAVLDALARSGAEALHPGYGFFSENADFARAITAAGVVFIGPPPEAIEIMGDKLSARVAAEKAGVAGVPGTTDVLISADQVVAFGEEYGWPVAIKAAFGGGGRGIRVVRSPDEVSAAFESARSEALAGFGRAECYVEKYLTWPRHVEMQILADSHGNCLWLGERDCSAQRRHQKLVEEAPAPDFPDDLRRAMGEAAVRVARACGYVNAGTVEFLYDPPGDFWFLEMNTRLQVEHPVTELTTGIDLVVEQLRVAAGEPLRLIQAEVACRGHAIECRINAEDPTGGRFLPSPGTITALVAASGPGVRWDAGYQAGDEVPPFYDNLVGKLVVCAADRTTAIARMVRALGETKIQGIATTIPAHLAILGHADFVAARHSTRWVEERIDLADVAVPQAAPAAGPPRPAAEVEVGGRWYTVPRFTNAVESAAQRGVAVSAPPSRRRGTTSSRSRGSSGTVISPMQGRIVTVLVEVGDRVAVDQPVCVIEAMKMESTLTAERAGTVLEIAVTPGQPVRADEVVVLIGDGDTTEEAR